MEEYLITGVIQSKAEMSLYTETTQYKKIESCRDVQALYEKAYDMAEKHLHSRDYLSAIRSMDCIAVWRRNIFGGWAKIDK